MRNRFPTLDPEMAHLAAGFVVGLFGHEHIEGDRQLFAQAGSAAGSPDPARLHFTYQVDTYTDSFLQTILAHRLSGQVEQPDNLVGIDDLELLERYVALHNLDTSLVTPGSDGHQWLTMRLGDLHGLLTMDGVSSYESAVSYFAAMAEYLSTVQLQLAALADPTTVRLNPVWRDVWTATAFSTYNLDRYAAYLRSEVDTIRTIAGEQPHSHRLYSEDGRLGADGADLTAAISHSQTYGQQLRQLVAVTLYIRRQQMLGIWRGLQVENYLA